VPVGETVAVIGEEGEEVSVPSDTAGGDTSGARHRNEAVTDEPRDDAPQSAEKPAVAPEREADREEGREAAAQAAVSEGDTSGARHRNEPATNDPQGSGRVKASPLARRLARERSIDLASLRGTGPEGRIVAEDVERAEVQKPAAERGEVESVPLTNIRKTIARRLTQAWTVPVFQLTVSADMTRTNELVARARDLDSDVKVTVTDVLTKVCASA